MMEGLKEENVSLPIIVFSYFLALSLFSSFLIFSFQFAPQNQVTTVRDSDNLLAHFPLRFLFFWGEKRSMNVLKS